MMTYECHHRLVSELRANGVHHRIVSSSIHQPTRRHRKLPHRRHRRYLFFVFAVHVGAQGEPHQHQEDVEDDETEIAQLEHVRADQDGQRGQAATQAHEQGVYGGLGLVQQLLGGLQPQHLPCCIVDGQGTKILRHLDRLDEAEDGHEGHGCVGHQGDERRRVEQRLHAAGAEDARYHEGLPDQRREVDPDVQVTVAGGTVASYQSSVVQFFPYTFKK